MCLKILYFIFDATDAFCNIGFMDIRISKKLVSTFAACLALSASAVSAATFPKSEAEDTEKLMGKGYWELWNPQVQKKIDADIEKNRKADAEINLGEPAPDGDVKVEQIKHDFIFGAHIFNFNQLGTPERNAKYKALYGSLFNSATVAFYWKVFEMQPNRPRFVEEYWDTEEFWNNCPNPAYQPHWRRPATDPVIEYCNKAGIRVHGHPLVWGNQMWHYPQWIKSFMTPEEKAAYDNLKPEPKPTRDIDPKSSRSISQEEAEKTFAHFGEKISEFYAKRISEIAARYGDKIQSYDVVNESATDFSEGVMVNGSKITRSCYGFMQGDYAFDAFNLAQKYLPVSAKLNINDYKVDKDYVAQIKDLQKRGARIDIAGMQMHLFNPKESAEIAKGKKTQCPEVVFGSINTVAATGLPIHMSEITITAPGTTKRDWDVQAVIAQNLYRAWFSHPSVMGITWWNVVDDCGAPGEPSLSGIFTRDMQPKSAFYALDNLINKEWKTKTTVKPDKNGKITFRGFKGLYKITWVDKYGRQREMQYHLK